MASRKYGSWIEALEQVTKTININARGVRNCIADAISCGPPEWASQMLLPALGKDVSTAKEVISAVCTRSFCEEELCNNQPEVEEGNEKNTGVSGSLFDGMDIDQTLFPCPESVTECCRNAFREITMEDKFAELFNMVQGKPQELLDFHLIDIRMNAGTYGKSPELFASDMQKTWENVRAVGQKIIVLANMLSEYSEATYKKQVAPLFREEAGDNDPVDGSKKRRRRPSSKGHLHEPPQNINQHHLSKTKNHLGCIQGAEELNTPNLSNSKANEQKGSLNAGTEVQNTLTQMEVQNTLTHKDIASKNVDTTDQCLPNSLPYSEVELSAPNRVCRSCGINERDNCLVICDACERAYHIDCVFPALEGIPSGSWYCASCVASGKGNESMPKNIEKEGHHCIVCERLSRELEPENSGGVDESHTGGGQMGTCDGNVHSKDFEIHQCGGEGRGGTEVHVSTQEEKLHNNELPLRKFCKVCSAGERNGDNLIECANTNCLFKYFHLGCLKPPLKCKPPPIWYCPSCICAVCHVDENDDAIVLCDGCDYGYHIYCLKPRLSAIPKCNWYCSSCRRKRKMRKERYPAGIASTEGLHASNASINGSPSQKGREALNSQDHEMKISTPQDQSQAIQLESLYSIAQEEVGAYSDENFGSKDNFRISFRKKINPESGECAESKETGKRKRKSSEPRRSEG